MKDFFKRVKADAIMSAVLCIALGVVLIVWPGETINIVCKVLAAGLIILGEKGLLTIRNLKMVPR